MKHAKLSWDDLRHLEALGRLGTAGRAARELGTSASTVYRRIANLEAALGISCVHAGESRLTEAGEALAKVATETGRSLATVTSHARDLSDAPNGEVSLTTVEGAMPLLAPVLAALTARYPELTLRLVVGDHGPSVRRREVDIAVGVMPTPPESLWGRRLFPIRYRVYGTKLARDRTPRRWITTGRGMNIPEREAWESEHATEVVATTGTVPSLLHLLRASMGVAVLPERLGDDEPDLVELTAYRASLDPLERTAWLLTHPDLREVQRVRVVMDALVEALE